MSISKNLIIATLITGFGLASSAMAATYLVVEQAIESSTHDVTLPGAVNSTIFVKSCSDCEEQRLRITPNTLCEVNNQPVSYADLKRITEDHDGSLAIFYDAETDAITRFVMKGNFVVDLPPPNSPN